MKMPLVPCPECQTEVSTQALACPQCAFPFPGEQNHPEHLLSQRIGSCQNCGLLVSKQAQSCPHCGLSTEAASQIEEKPYLDHDIPSPIPEENHREVPQKCPQDQVKGDKIPEPIRKRAPLWQDSSFPSKADYDLVSYRYPPSKKKAFIIGLLIFVIVAISIGLGAIWQFQGLNPLEALVNWRM